MSTTVPVEFATPISPLRFRQALEQARPAMAALDEGELLDINLDIPSAAVAILAYGDSEPLKELRAQAAAELPSFDLSHFDMFVTWALAAAQAHTEVLATSRSVNYQEWVTSLEQTRDLLKSEIQLLAKRGMLDGSRLSELRGGGHKNLAFDVLLCCTVLRSHWDTLAGRTTTTLDEIARAEQLADKLATAVGVRDLGTLPKTAESDQRRRAYTLMARAHDQITRAATYLRWSQGDVERIIPSLYLNNGTSRSTKTNAEEPAPTPGPTPQPVTPPAPGNASPSPTNGSNGNGAAKPAQPAAAPGMAGSEPLDG